MSQRWTTLIVLCIACQPDIGGDPSAKPEIVVGEYSSLTGSEATFGQSTHNGVTMAFDEVNAAGGVHGRKLQIIA